MTAFTYFRVDLPLSLEGAFPAFTVQSEPIIWQPDLQHAVPPVVF